MKNDVEEEHQTEQMKKTYFTDILRTILRQKIAFISIGVIGFIAVAAYFGINSTAAALKANAADFYKKHNFRDFEIVSTMMLTQEDLDHLKSMDEVKDAEGVHQENGYVSVSDEREKVSVISLPKRINTITLLEGRLPENDTECAVEEEFLYAYALRIGDTLTVTNSAGNPPSTLKKNTFTITGSVRHPDHYTYKKYSPGERYLLVKDSAFDLEALKGNYRKAVIETNHSPDALYYSGIYNSEMKEIAGALQAVCEERAALRTEQVKQDFRDALQKSQKEADEGKQKLADARKQLDDGAAAIASGEQALTDGRAQLDQAAAMLAEGREKLAVSRQTLEDMQAKAGGARAELDKAAADLNSGAARLIETYNWVSEIKNGFRELIKEAFTSVLGSAASDAVPWAAPDTGCDINDPGLSIGLFRITDSFSFDLTSTLSLITRDVLYQALAGYASPEEIDAVIADLTQQPAFARIETDLQQELQPLLEWSDKHAEYIAGRTKYLEGEAQYAAGAEALRTGWETYNAMLQQYTQKEAEYYSAVALYEQKSGELASAREELKAKEADYKKGQEEYQEGLKKLKEAEDSLSALPPCTWLLLGAKENAGYLHVFLSADSLEKLVISFAMLFIVLSVLVIYATITKIVEEQRTLIGAQCALGFSRAHILIKYIIFGAGATVIGFYAGALTGTYIVQKIVLKSYDQFYVAGHMTGSFLPLPFIILLPGGIGLAALAVWLGCRRLLKESVKELMQERIPTPRRVRTQSSRKKTEGSLYSRLILRNLESDIGRILITIISIAGSCALLMIGFTLRNNVEKTIHLQFDEINQFEYTLGFDPAIAKEDGNEFRELLDKQDIPYVDVFSESVLIKTADGYAAYQLISAGEDDMEKVYRLNDAKTRRPISLPESGVVVPRRFAEVYQCKAGDTITLFDGNLQPHEVKVAAVCDFYFGRFLFMSEKGCCEAFDREIKYNRLCTGDITDAWPLYAAASKLDGFTELTPSSNTRSTYTGFLSTLNLVAVLLIVAAGLMAFFVLLNLINLHLRLKKRELTTMRINGFTVKEVIGYAARESVVTGFFGILLGILLGAVLAYIITRLQEHMFTGYIRSINTEAILFSVLISLVFIVVINILGFRKIRTLNLTDIE